MPTIPQDEQSTQPLVDEHKDQTTESTQTQLYEAQEEAMEIDDQDEWLVLPL